MMKTDSCSSWGFFGRSLNAQHPFVLEITLVLAVIIIFLTNCEPAPASDVEAVDDADVFLVLATFQSNA
jgi:hypothetical protein